MIYIEEMHWPVSQQQSPEKPYVLKNTSDDDSYFNGWEKPLLLHHQHLTN